MGGQDGIITTIQRFLVKQVTFYQTTLRTWFGMPSFGAACHLGHGLAVLCSDIDDLQLQLACGCELLAELPGIFRIGVLIVATEIKIQSIHVLAQLPQDVPHGERILPARYSHQQTFVFGEHVIFFDDAFGLVEHPFQVMLLAVSDVMLPQIDDGFLTAFFTLHA